MSKNLKLVTANMYEYKYDIYSYEFLAWTTNFAH